MARIQAHELAFAFERLVEKKLRGIKVPRSRAIAEEWAGELISEVPSEAFEAREPWEDGLVFFHDDVREDAVVACQKEILETHINLREKKTPITLYLSTFGGSVFAGLALASTIQEVRRAGRSVNVVIQGAAMSMGSVIAQVCDHRSMEPFAWFMLHNLRHWVHECDGISTPNLLDEAAVAERLEQQVCMLYSARTGKPPEYYRKKFDRRDWFLSADEALAEGLIDAISEVKPFPTFRKRRAA